MLGTLHAVFVAAIFRRLRPGAEGGAASGASAPAMRIELSYPPKYRDALARARATTAAPQPRSGASAGCRLVLDTAQPVVFRWRSAAVEDGAPPLVSLRFVPAASAKTDCGDPPAAFATPSVNIVPLEGRGQLSALGCSRLAFVVDDAAQHAAQRAAAARRVEAWAAADEEADQADPFVEGAPVVYMRYVGEPASPAAAGTREARALLARADGDITRGVQLFYREGRNAGTAGSGRAPAALEEAPAEQHWECCNCQCIYGPGFAAPVATEVCETCGEDSRDEALRRGLSRAAQSLIEASALRRGVGQRVAARSGAAPAAAAAAAAAPRTEVRVAATIVAVHRDADERYFTIRIDNGAGAGRTVQTVVSRLAAVARGSAAAAALAPRADPPPAIGARVVCSAHTFVASSIGPRVRGDAQRLAPLRRPGRGNARGRGSAAPMGTAEATHFVLKDSAGRHRSAAALDFVSAECVAEPRSLTALLPSALHSLTSSAAGAEAANLDLARSGASSVVQAWKFDVRARWSDALCATQDALREDRRAPCTVSAVDHVMLSAPGPHLFGALALRVCAEAAAVTVGLCPHATLTPLSPPSSLFAHCPRAALARLLRRALQQRRVRLWRLSPPGRAPPGVGR